MKPDQVLIWLSLQLRKGSIQLVQQVWLLKRKSLIITSIGVKLILTPLPENKGYGLRTFIE